MNLSNPDPVYTLEDLESWDKDFVPLAVIGHPVAHSISPAMHNAAIARMARQDRVFKHWRYFRFDIHPEDLPQALELFHRKKFRGLNLTIPHKVDALRLCVRVESSARQKGAVNTLRWQEDGYHGFNTDGFGLKQALLETLGVSLKNSTVLLLGAGGAARAAAVQCLESGCRELWIGNRNQERLAHLLAMIRTGAADHDMNFNEIPVHGFSLVSVPENLPQTGIVINATSLGLHDSDPAPLQLHEFRARTVIYDMIYNQRQTPLMKEGARLGFPNANGLSMLVWQGARSLEIWSDRKVPVEAMEIAARDAMGYDGDDAA